MHYMNEFLNEPSTDEVSRFFLLEKEIDAYPLTPEQRSRKQDILSHLTQYLGSREKFLEFLSELESLLKEAKEKKDAPIPKEPEKTRRKENEKFEAFMSQFLSMDDEHLRHIIKDELRHTSRESLILIYTVMLGIRKANG